MKPPDSMDSILFRHEGMPRFSFTHSLWNIVINLLLFLNVLLLGSSICANEETPETEEEERPRYVFFAKFCNT